MTDPQVQPGEAPLVERARAGDRTAFADLVRIHQDEVFTLALRLVADRELAADVTQDALVRAWRAMPRFRGDAKFSTWLYRITVNTAWTALRRDRRHRSEPLDSLGEEPASTGLAPEQAGIAADSSVRLRAALAELSEPLRIVVVLKDVYDWSHPEIAEHLDITVTAAKVRLHRGRKQLREILEHEVGDR
jgi:RNA polymerase sigma-70 factor (ECF subfamily)